MRIISYNLREHTASSELVALTEAHEIDVLCLQESDTTDMPDRLGRLVLADQTQSNRLGLSMYVREDEFTVHATRVFALRKSLHDRVLKPANERLLAAHLTDHSSGREILIGDFHGAPLTATNALRRKQIAAAHVGMQAIAPGVPSVMVGDFNYPWFIDRLERNLKLTGYQITRTPSPTYIRYKRWKGYFDFVTSSGFQIDDLDVLPRGVSDHLPIRLQATISA